MCLEFSMRIIEELGSGKATHVFMYCLETQEDFGVVSRF
jgi:hypothetical protein